VIQNRPASLLADPSFTTLPGLPVGLDLSRVPEWIKLSILFLGGVQPITGAMADAARGLLSDEPTLRELALFRERGTRFQIVFVVVSVATFIDCDGVPHGVPYALSLMPASKRGRVSLVGVEFIEQINLTAVVARDHPVYVGFDPFTGEWQGWGGIDIFMTDQPRAGFPDELGFVYDQFFLATEYDPDDVLGMEMLENEQANRKYLKHRQNLLFRPFADTRARRIWGAESPIELFLFQALLQRGLSPTLQMLFFSDGSVFPSLYHFWADSKAEEVPEMITEADMYFEEHRLAVFCDSTRHHRGGKAAQKDALISARLAAIDVRALRIPGALIVRDLQAAANLVTAAIA
jgi:hypothetical protein